MQLQKLLRILLIILITISILSCSDNFPTITPYLNQPDAQGMCQKFKLTDPKTLTFQFDSMAPCSDLLGGFGVPKGQLEAALAWGRREIKNCTPSSQAQPVQDQRSVETDTLEKASSIRSEIP